MYEFENKELEQKIKKAETYGKYLITITRLEPKGKLEHWWGMRNFQRSDIMSTLEHIKESIKKEVSHGPGDELESVNSKWQ